MFLQLDMAQCGARHHDLLEQSDHAIGEDDLHDFDWDAPRLKSERFSELILESGLGIEVCMLGVADLLQI